MKGVLREPLLQVLLLGVALFGLHRWLRPPLAASDEIVIRADALSAARENFLRGTGRLPSATDEQAIVDQMVDDEVLVREALAAGIAHDDPIVRRRLVERMTMVLEDAELVVPPPGEGELEAYLRTHADRYATPSERQAGAMPSLDAVRERVQRDWWLERRRQLYREARAQRRSRYVVRFEAAGR